jgi:hypothetical protein
MCVGVNMGVYSGSVLEKLTVQRALLEAAQVCTWVCASCTCCLLANSAGVAFTTGFVIWACPVYTDCTVRVARRSTGACLEC